jgi:hypothetical protein
MEPASQQLPIEGIAGFFYGENYKRKYCQKGWCKMNKKIKLSAFVRQECADYVNSECLGIDVFGKRFREQGNCWIMEQEPCVYFVRCVLPIAKERGYGNVISSYQKIDIDSEAKKNKVRNCECGESLPKGKQLCEKCRKKRRQNTKRIYQQKYRGS